MEEKIKEILKSFQKTEITEYYIYKNIADFLKGENTQIINKIAQEELNHYQQWKKFTGIDLKPNKLIVKTYSFLARIFGYTFALKLMERGEKRTQEKYAKLISQFPLARNLLEDEENHEKELLQMIDEERLKYVGSIVLGMNDAIVELSGALAGLTFAFQNPKLVAIAGLITGIAASLSMGASEYLSQRAEKALKPLKASLYTGSAYIISVIILIFPYFILSSPIRALVWSFINAVLIIGFFSFYLSVTKEYSFKKEFRDMILISSSVVFVSFLIGSILKFYLNVDI